MKTSKLTERKHTVRDSVTGAKTRCHWLGLAVPCHAATPLLHQLLVTPNSRVTRPTTRHSLHFTNVTRNWTEKQYLLNGNIQKVRLFHQGPKLKRFENEPKVKWNEWRLKVHFRNDSWTMFFVLTQTIFWNQSQSLVFIKNLIQYKNQLSVGHIWFDLIQSNHKTKRTTAYFLDHNV